MSKQVFNSCKNFISTLHSNRNNKQFVFQSSCILNNLILKFLVFKMVAVFFIKKSQNTFNRLY